MRISMRVLERALVFGLISLLLSATCLGQESRGSITGRVIDPQSAVIPNATVVVTNLATNVARRTATNETGYYEVILLDPGTYSVSAEASGFKKLVRSGITLGTGARLSVELKLEIGQTSTTITVTSDAPLLETSNAAVGRLLNSRDMANLPFTNMNPFALQAMAAGMVYTGNLQPDNSRALDHAASANFASGGLGTGTNEFLLDGNPVTGTNGGRAGYVPNSDAVDEIRIETMPFDASMGHAIGAFISATVKTGTNGLHGSGFWQTQQFRWNATPHFTRLNYESGLANGTVAPGTPKQQSGRVSQPGFSVGGPVYIPKLLNGKDKLFFFLSYSKLTSIAPSYSTPIYTVPTEAMRKGDFSALLKVPTNPSQYIIYDPRTAKLVSGHVVRTPFPNNIIPPEMMNNPIAKFYMQLYPLPNNPPGLVQPDGTQNFYDSSQANNDYFPDFMNRIDYNLSPRHRLNGKWYFNVRNSDQYDWAHSTPLKGVMSNGLYRPTRGGSLDYLFTLNPHNMLNISFSISQYSEGSKKPIDFQYNAKAVGLPSYIDDKAGSSDVLPWINIAGVANAASTSFIGAPGLNQRGTTGQFAIKMTTIKGSHTFKYGWEERRYHYASVNPLGNTTGYYQFSNTYVRQADNTPSNATTTVGLGFASFLMGLPTSITLDTNDTGYWSTPYHALYFQDDFRLTPRLRIGFGLRFEREGGTTERFNRGLTGQYDFSYVPPYAQAVEAAYASLLTGTSSAINTLKQGMPASSFKVAGGVTYLGQQYDNYTSGTSRFLPNASVAYQITNKTVLRAGTGMSADTYNAMNSSSRTPQNGYSQTTSTILSSDNGLTFCCGVGAASNLGTVNPLMDPFPVLPSGSRWVMPRGNSLGSDVLDGQGFTFYPRDYAPARSWRYSIGIQRELHGNHMIEVSYGGSYASVPMTRSLSPLPSQYWNFNTQWDANVAAVDNAMKATVANPFVAGLAAIKTSNATLYNYLSNISMFTSTTLQVQQLLRAYPNAGFSLNQTNAVRGHVVDNEVRILYTKRMSKGIQTNVQYTHMWGRQQWFPNQFDRTPAWQLNSNIRPNRLVWSAVYDLPFGKSRSYLTHGPLQHLVGGWTLSWIYTYQTGPLISMGNLFYYGTVDQIVPALNHDSVHQQDIHRWYDRAAVWTGGGAPPSGFVGLEGRSANQPGTYQARIFPQYIGDMRADGIRNWDVKILRGFRIKEQMSFTVSADFLNLTNHTQFGAPNMTVTSSAFGQLSSQVNSGRIIQLNARFQF